LPIIVVVIAANLTSGEMLDVALGSPSPARRRPRRTAMLLGPAQGLRGRTGMPLPAQVLARERADVERAAGTAAGALGARAFGEMLEQGRAMSVKEAADYAAADDDS
jgi:hypothetical protein